MWQIRNSTSRIFPITGSTPRPLPYQTISFIPPRQTVSQGISSPLLELTTMSVIFPSSKTRTLHVDGAVMHLRVLLCVNFIQMVLLLITIHVLRFSHLVIC